MAGWFLTICALAPATSTQPVVWRALAGGLAAWYVPDTAYSLVSGYWPNAALNTAIAVLFLPAFAALRPHPRAA